MIQRLKGLGPGLALAAVATVACGGDPTGPDIEAAELTTRVTPPTGVLYEPGTHIIPLPTVHRDPVLYIPPSYDPATPAPLVVLFHGAGGSADNWQSPYEHADRLGLVLLIMQSRSVTWDMMGGGFGPDVAVLDSALTHVFQRVAVAPDDVIFAGFSDGAAYALTLTLVNSDLVRRGVGFSPGSIVPVERPPLPDLFISHGTRDRILSPDRTRRLVAALNAHGFQVWFAEFEGGHEVPAEVSRAAFDWMVL